MDNQPDLNVLVNSNSSSGKRWFSLKLLFLILGIFILVGVVLAARTLISSLGTKELSKALINKVQTKPKITLISTQKEYKVGEVIPVAVSISTGGFTTDGTDVVLHIDPRVLEASSSNIIKGKIYPEYPIAVVEESRDTIRISGVTSLDKEGFSGEGTLATILFRAKQAGQTTLTLDFKPGDTTDSNIVAQKEPQDILEEVGNLELTIR